MTVDHRRRSVVGGSCQLRRRKVITVTLYGAEEAKEEEPAAGARVEAAGTAEGEQLAKDALQIAITRRTTQFHVERIRIEGNGILVA